VERRKFFLEERREGPRFKVLSDLSLFKLLYEEERLFLRELR
jgi:hypothetical protein